MASLYWKASKLFSVSSLIDPKTKIGAYYHKNKYIPMDRLLDYYNGLMKIRAEEEKETEQIDREIDAVKEIFKETAHE